MDRNLPEIDGSLYVEMLRSKNITTPVIFLSAKNSKEAIKEGFVRGADDYIVKPFDIEELLLRIKAVLARYKTETKELKELLEYRDLKLDLNLYNVTIGSQEIGLTKLEATLLKVMLANKGKVLDRDFMLKQIWHDSEGINQKTVNVAIKRLKEKIDPTREKEYIKTIRGVGYIIP
jgi:DNA-binding response OmpR family regulator